MDFISYLMLYHASLTAFSHINFNFKCYDLAFKENIQLLLSLEPNQLHHDILVPGLIDHGLYREKKHDPTYVIYNLKETQHGLVISVFLFVLAFDY